MPPNKGVQISNPMYDIEDTPRDTPRSDEDDEEPQIPEDANRTAGDSDRADGTDEQPPQATAAGSQPDSFGRKKSVAGERRRKLESGARALFKCIDGSASGSADAHANGSLSKMELASALEENGLMVGDDTLSMIFDELDAGGGTARDGQIDESEFVQFILSVRALSKAEMSSQVFVMSVKSFGFWMITAFFIADFLTFARWGLWNGTIHKDTQYVLDNISVACLVTASSGFFYLNAKSEVLNVAATDNTRLGLLNVLFTRARELVDAANDAGDVKVLDDSGDRAQARAVHYRGKGDKNMENFCKKGTLCKMTLGTGDLVAKAANTTAALTNEAIAATTHARAVATARLGALDLSPEEMQCMITIGTTLMIPKDVESITKDGFMALLGDFSIPLSHRQAFALFKDIDTSGNGTLERSEIVDYMMNCKALSTSEKAVIALNNLLRSRKMWFLTIMWIGLFSFFVNIIIWTRATGSENEVFDYIGWVLVPIGLTGTLTMVWDGCEDHLENVERTRSSLQAIAIEYYEREHGAITSHNTDPQIIITDGAALMMADIDKDGDGLEMNEFREALQNAHIMASPNALQEIYDEIDVNNDCAVTMSELGDYIVNFKPLDESQAYAYIKRRCLGQLVTWCIALLVFGIIGNATIYTVHPEPYVPLRAISAFIVFASTVGFVSLVFDCERSVLNSVIESRSILVRAAVHHAESTRFSPRTPYENLVDGSQPRTPYVEIAELERAGGGAASLDDDGSRVECANPLEDALAYQRPSNIDRLRAALSPRSAGIGAYSPVAN